MSGGADRPSSRRQVIEQLEQRYLLASVVSYSWLIDTAPQRLVVEFDGDMRNTLQPDDPVSSQSFWSALVVSCFQPTAAHDKDPDGVGSVPSIAVGFETGVLGLTPGYNNESGIFLEVLRDGAATLTSTTDEAHTMVHEMGHQGGVSGDPHPLEGIMMDEAPLGQDHFSNDSQRIFRSNSVW